MSYIKELSYTQKLFLGKLIEKMEHLDRLGFKLSKQLEAIYCMMKFMTECVTFGNRFRG